MAGYCNPHLMFVFRLVYSVVGVLIGLIICAAFTVHFNNRAAAMWGLASSVMAALCMAQFIYLYVIKERFRKAPSAVVLTGFGVVAVLGIGVGVGGFVSYLGIGIIQSLNNLVTSLVTSEYIVCVWSFAVFKWGVTTFVYSMVSFKYLKKVPLVEHEAEVEDDEKHFSVDLEEDDPKLQA